MVRRLVPLLPLVLLAACSRPEPGFDGIGPWHIGRTTMKEAVRCDPAKSEPDLHWCYLNPEITFAEQRATVDLYFRGDGDDAPLVEILMGIATCRIESIDKVLAAKLGPAPERSGSTFVWHQKTATIVARMPSSPGECEIIFLAPNETRRLATLTGNAGTGDQAGSPPAP